MSVSEQTTPYDEILYTSSAFASSRPDNLYTVAKLSGFTAADVEHCRVLELGCAIGNNLLPMAQALPRSTFLGIDLSAKQIEKARAMACESNLKNIEFRCQDILTFCEDSKFDYIIVHGIYSWVPQPVRDKILEICKSSLAPNGLAYVSYNTYPGWHLKQITRDMMMFHARLAKGEREKLTSAKDSLNLVQAAQARDQSIYAKVIRDIAPKLASNQDWYMVHDDLEANNTPVYLADFVAHALANGLKYLCGSQPSMNLVPNMAPYWQEQLAKFCKNPTDMEQYADFISGTQYRESVLCLADVEVSSKGGLQSVPQLWFAAKLIEVTNSAQALPPNSIRFRNPIHNQDLTTANPLLITALRAINCSWPHAVSFQAVLETVSKIHVEADHNLLSETLAKGLLAAYTSNALEIWGRPTDFLATNLDHPRMTPLARAQAGQCGPLISMRHNEFQPVDHFVKFIAPLMDGTRTAADLIRAVAVALNQKIFNLHGPDGKLISVDGLPNFMQNALHIFHMNSMLCKVEVRAE